MSVSLTAFGRITRKLRIDRGELLKDMAKQLGITVSYLSAVETGKRNVPHNWIERLQQSYDLSSDETMLLQKAASDSRVYDKIDVSHLSFDDKLLIRDVVTKLPVIRQQLSEHLEQVEPLDEVINNDEQND